LWQRHGRCRELQRPLDVGHSDLASTLSRVVLLVGGDLGDDVGGGLVELVEVILLGRRFLNTQLATRSYLAYWSICT
jgi:hypothetical protein